MSYFFGRKIKKESGISLIEALVGIALMAIVFMGVFGVIQLGLRMVGQAKARVTATALANEKVELARNLAYDDVGTTTGIPTGTILENATTTKNGITFSIKTTVVYIDDPFDNSSPADPLASDYKRVKVKVSWSGAVGGEVVLQTDVAPKGIETTAGGGILSILVFNASGQPVPQADVHVENATSVPAIDAHYQTDNNGRLFLPGAPACNECYKITATKAGYSIDRTYAVGEMVRGTALTSPLNPLATVIEGQMTETSFSIDTLATKNIQAFVYAAEEIWTDTFSDESKISQKNDVVLNAPLAAITLEQESGQYESSGNLISTTATPAGATSWGRLVFNDYTPVGTDVKYQLLYATNSAWALVPDADLTVGGVANSSGFYENPVDISGLSLAQYPELRIKGNFSTTDPNSSPTLYDWALTWFSAATSTPVQNLAFTMRGSKTLGTDAGGQLVYKYEENLNTGASGQLTVSNLEWDSYTIIVNPAATGFDLADSNLPQAVSVGPGASVTTTLKLAGNQTNTLFVTVKNGAGAPLSGAFVRLYKSGYDEQLIISNAGQVFFTPLSSADYSLEIKLSGYEDFLVVNPPGPLLNITGDTTYTAAMAPR